jgi:hypothetical protein
MTMSEKLLGKQLFTPTNTLKEAGAGVAKHSAYNM